MFSALQNDTASELESFFSKLSHLLWPSSKEDLNNNIFKMFWFGSTSDSSGLQTENLDHNNIALKKAESRKTQTGFKFSTFENQRESAAALREVDNLWP